jgi:murein L,D-transpeptidase YcbB/YkuD
MALVLMRGSVGSEVAALRKTLASLLGAEAQLFGQLAKGQDFDADLEAAVRRWQTGVGLIADGIVGARCKNLCRSSSL